MKKTLPGTVALACFVLGTGCQTASDSGFSRDFEVFVDDGSLDTVKLDGNGFSTDVSVDRDRVGARFAFGGGATQGFFQVFSEEWSIGSDASSKYEALAIGGGAMGSPLIGVSGEELSFILPWRVDMNLGIGENTGLVTEDVDLVYFEFHGDVGVGLLWKGLRPSVGLALSTLSGVLAPQTVSDVDISGLNTGLFLDVQYKHPEYLAYGHLRLLAGDYEVTTVGIGFRF